MSDSSELSPSARWGFGLLSVALGLFPMLAAFDVGPIRREEINGPPWLGFVAGSLFVFVGLALVAGERLAALRLHYVFVFVVVGGMAAIGNWVAFGAGTRACNVSMAGFFASTRGGADLLCRAGFGIGALILNGLLVMMLAKGLAKMAGPGAAASRLESVARWVMFVALSPILVPMVLVLLAGSLLGAAREYFKTGRWPRNEEFLARMRLRKC